MNNELNLRIINETKCWLDHFVIQHNICPFAKKYFVFEKDVAGYTEHNIYESFTHPLLSGYEGDFSEYVDEIE